MKTAKWIVVAAMMTTTACVAVEDEPTVATDDGQPTTAGPADSMTQRATKSAPSAASEDEPSEDASTSLDEADANPTDIPPADEPADEQPQPDEPGPADDVACTPQECGPGLLAPNVFCSDGSTGGPVCERDEDGKCGWDIRECPDRCTADECGPQTLRAANILCADGTMGGPVCGRDAMRACGWYYRSCPDECPDDMCGDKPDFLQICDDGTELHPVCTVDQAASVDAGTCSWKLPTCQ